MTPDRGRSSWERHDWIYDDAFDAFCLSVSTASSAAAIVAFDADPASERLIAFADIPWETDEEDPIPLYEAVQIAERDGRLVCLELNGWQGVEERVAEVLSRDGFHAGLHRGGNGLTGFIWAVDGKVVRAFDPVLSGPGMHWPADIGEPLREEAGLPWGDTDQHVMAAAALLVERLTGVTLARDWLLLEPHPTYRAEPRANSG